MATYIRKNVINPTPVMSISSEDFDLLKSSRIALTAGLAFEESYDLLINNHIEFRNELYKIPNVKDLQNNNIYQEFYGLRSSINRRIVNVLTATRLYLDQTPQRMALCAKDPDKARVAFNKRKNLHYDTSFSYRFLEHLRNHVQHCGLAVHGMQLGLVKKDENGQSIIENTIQVFAQKEYLAEDRIFKKLVFDEINEKVEITDAIHQYIRCIGDLHEIAREYVLENLKEKRSLIQQHLSKYSEMNNDNTIGLTAFRDDSKGSREIVPLLLDWDDIRLNLLSTNPTLKMSI